MVHHLKCWPDPFAAMLAGVKTHEMRIDDRGFNVGDELVLEEWRPTPSAGFYTGRTLRRLVTYITRGPEFGVPKGYAVMSCAPLDLVAGPSYVAAEGP